MGRKPKKVFIKDVFDDFERIKATLTFENAYKLKVLRDVAEGMYSSRKEGAEFGFMSVRQLQRLLKLINDQGIQGLRHYKFRTKITSDFVNQVVVPQRDIFFSAEGRIPSARELYDQIMWRSEVCFGYSAFCKFVKRSGILRTAERVEIPSDWRPVTWSTRTEGCPPFVPSDYCPASPGMAERSADKRATMSGGDNLL